MCAKFWLSAIIYANVIGKNSFSSGKKKFLVPGLKLLKCFWFAYKIFAVTILNIIPLTERTFQSRMLSFLRKSSSVSSFL